MKRANHISPKHPRRLASLSLWTQSSQNQDETTYQDTMHLIHKTNDKLSVALSSVSRTSLTADRIHFKGEEVLSDITVLLDTMKEQQEKNWHPIRQTLCSAVQIGLGYDGCNNFETQKTVQLLEVAAGTLQQYVSDVGEV
jgi:hypothetical protein